MLHNLDIINILSGHHGIQHSVFLSDPLFCRVSLRYQFEQGQSIEQALLAQAGKFGELAVTRVNGGQTVADFGAGSVLGT